MEWQAVASRARGYKHIKGGKPCQDYGDYEILSGGRVIIGVVSDGMGSAKHSEIGSQLAVEVAISELKRESWLYSPKDEKHTQKIFKSILEVVRAKLKNWADINGYSVQDLACTLLAFIATPQWLAAMQIGDGFVVVRSKGGDYQLLFKPDKGEFANETTPLTSSDALREMQVCLRSIPYKFICAATDGIENISLIKTKDWKPFDNFFRPLENHMLSPYILEQKKKKLDDFLNSEKINQSTDDDKTLLLCVYQDSVPIEKIADPKKYF